MTGLTPDMTDAVVLRHGVLRLTFGDGTSGEVAVLERMRGPVFKRARTAEGFAPATLDPETATVVWPGGADLAPDTLYERVRTGIWPGQDLAASSGNRSYAASAASRSVECRTRSTARPSSSSAESASPGRAARAPASNRSSTIVVTRTRTTPLDATPVPRRATASPSAPCPLCISLVRGVACGSTCASPGSRSLRRPAAAAGFARRSHSAEARVLEEGAHGGKPAFPRA
jgi:hypothetical protein